MIELDAANNTELPNQAISNTLSSVDVNAINIDQTPQNSSIQTPPLPQYEPPSIVTDSKKNWHYRSMKDLGNGGIPLLPGVGPQRTPITVKVKAILI